MKNIVLIAIFSILAIGYSYAGNDNQQVQTQVQVQTQTQSNGVTFEGKATTLVDNDEYLLVQCDPDDTWCVKLFEYGGQWTTLVHEDGVKVRSYYTNEEPDVSEPAQNQVKITWK